MNEIKRGREIEREIEREGEIEGMCQRTKQAECMVPPGHASGSRHILAGHDKDK